MKTIMSRFHGGEVHVSRGNAQLKRNYRTNTEVMENVAQHSSEASR